MNRLPLSGAVVSILVVLGAVAIYGWTAARSDEPGLMLGKDAERQVRANVKPISSFPDAWLPSSPEDQAEKALGGSEPNEIVGSVILPERVRPIAVDSDAVYALRFTPENLDLREGPGAIVRIDRRTHEIIRSKQLNFVDGGALAGGRLWTAGTEDGKNKPMLFSFDSRDLKPLGRLAIPNDSADPAAYLPLTLAATPTRLWAGAGKTLYEIDAATGAILGSSPQDHTITSLAVDPKATAIYLALFNEGEQRITVTKISPIDRSVVAHSKDHYGALAGGRLAASPGGLWMSFPTGMLGAVVHLDANLSRLTRSDPYGYSFEGSNSLRAFAVPGLWISDPGTGRLICADAASGTVGQSWPVEAGGMVGEGGTVYLEIWSGLLEFTPGERCFSTG